MKTERKKRNMLNLQQKVSVLEMTASGRTSRTIAAQLSVGKTQINNIVRSREDIMRQWHAGLSGTRKSLHMRKCTYAEVNERVYAWVCEQRSRNVTVNGTQIQSKASQLAMEMGQDTFLASNGWLYSFQVRNGLTRSGRDLQVAIEDTRAERLGVLASDYASADIFSCVETCLMYRLLPTEDRVDGYCRAGERADERLTVLLGAGADGHKLEPLLIGNGGKVATGNIMYQTHPLAWMTSAAFAQWLKKLNRKMRGEDRKILLMLLDNAPAQRHVELSNVRLVSSAGLLKPVWDALVHATKRNYRKQVLAHVAAASGETDEEAVQVKYSWHAMGGTVVVCLVFGALNFGGWGYWGFPL